MLLGPVGIEQAFDQRVNEVGKIGSQARPLAGGGKTLNVFLPMARYFL